MELENDKLSVVDINLKLKRFSRLLENRFNEIYDKRFEYKSFYRLYEIMHILSGSENCTMNLKEISEVKKVTQQSFGKHFVKLIVLELVEYKHAPDSDGRFKWLTLTDYGLDTLGICDQIILDIQKEFIPEAEHCIYDVMHQALVNMLNKIEGV